MRVRTSAVRTIKRAAKRKLKSDAEANAGPAPSDPAYTAARFLVITAILIAPEFFDLF